MIQVTLDDVVTLRDIPNGFDNFEEIIERDDNIFGYVIKYPLDLMFYGDGFEYLHTKKLSDGYLQKVKITINYRDISNVESTIVGYFYLMDAEFEYTERTVSVSIEDENYSAIIRMHQKTKVNISATLAIDGQTTIVPPAAVTASAFTPSTGAFLATNVYGYDIDDVLRQVLAYISNDTIVLDDQYFANTTYFGKSTSSVKFMVTNQYRLLNRGTAPVLEISFESLMKFLHSKFNLWWTIEIRDDLAYFVLKHADDMFSVDGSVAVRKIVGLKERCLQDYIYSAVEVGANNAKIEYGTSVGMPYVPLLGFGKETFSIGTDAVIDNKLDLVTDNDWVYDHNQIEQWLTSGVSFGEYETSNLVLEYSGAIPRCVRNDYGRSGYKYYNFNLTNGAVLGRFKLPDDIINHIAPTTGDNRFLAFSNANSTLSGVSGNLPLTFINDDTTNGYDYNGRYDTATGRYTAASTGVVKFGYRAHFTIDSIEQTFFDPYSFIYRNHVWITITMRHYNSGGTLLRTVSRDIGKEVRPIPNVTGNSVNTTYIYPYEQVNTAASPYTAEINAEFYLNATDYVTFELGYNSLPGVPIGSTQVTFLGQQITPSAELIGCKLTTDWVFDAGGIVFKTSGGDYPSVLLNADKIIPLKDWNTLKSNLTQLMTLDIGDHKPAILCWVKKISRNLKTGESKIETITTTNNMQL